MGKKFRIGRIISIIISVIIIYLSLQPIGDGGRIDRLLTLVPLSIAAWLFYRGAKKVFDYRITGETYVDEWDVVRDESEGGFLEHCVGAAIVFTPICAIDTFVFWGHSLTRGFYWLVPVVLIILNIKSMIKSSQSPEDDDI